MWELFSIVTFTGLVIFSIAGPQSVYTAYATARGSLASLLDHDSADLTFLACTTTREPESNQRNRHDTDHCEGTFSVTVKAMPHHN